MRGRAGEVARELRAGQLRKTGHSPIVSIPDPQAGTFLPCFSVGDMH